MICRICIKVIFSALVILFQCAYAQEATVTLESTVIGNQEQPSVLYIVPWKSPGSSADLYRPVASQLSAIFDHVERAELRRQIHYLNEIKQQEKLLSTLDDN